MRKQSTKLEGTPDVAVQRVVRRRRNVMTYEIAMAAGFDAGNRHASKHGRKVWTVEDFDAATRTVDKLLEVDPQKYEQGKTPNG